MAEWTDEQKNAWVGDVKKNLAEFGEHSHGIAEIGVDEAATEPSPFAAKAIQEVAAKCDAEVSGDPEREVFRDESGKALAVAWRWKLVPKAAA